MDSAISSLPSILIVSRGVWDDTKGTSSTLSNLFSDYPSEKLSMIYTETKAPNTSKCTSFFQISEYALIKKLFRWSTETGREISISSQIEDVIPLQDVRREEKALGFVRRHRSIVFSLCREILWGIGLWKSEALLNYINKRNPDVLWFDGSTNIFLNNLYHFVFKAAGKPSAIFLMDDNYTYKSVIHGHYLYRLFMRVSARRVIKECSKVFVISPKMKEEFDSIFGVNSVILTKGIDFKTNPYKENVVGSPLKMVYLGQILYGRIDTLIMIVKALDEINKDGLKVLLSVYTNNYISPHYQSALIDSKSVKVMSAVPYDQVPEVIDESDVLLFVESLKQKYSKDIRLSFSTKITDYLARGKCILAVGPKDSAPMDYFEREQCAVLAHNPEELVEAIESLLDPHIVQTYSKKAYEVGKKNHDKDLINERLFKGLKEIMVNN